MRLGSSIAGRFEPARRHVLRRRLCDSDIKHLLAHHVAVSREISLLKLGDVKIFCVRLKLGAGGFFVSLGLKRLTISICSAAFKNDALVVDLLTV
jgi:hypothetical protein